jgi:hypothetical protein
MDNQEFNCSITVDITPKDAFKTISQVSDWWVNDVDGQTEKLNDRFTVHFGTTWVAFTITEFVPETTIVWFVSDCNLPWNTDLREWNGTRVVWSISSHNQSTQIDFSHVGLTRLSCRNQCMTSWTGYIKQSLFKLITEGKGLPNQF